MSAIFFGTLIFVNLPRFLSIHLYFFHFANENCRGFVCMDTNWQISSFFGEKDHLHNGHKCKKVLPLDSNGFFTYISMPVFMSICLSFSFEIFLSIFIFVYCYFCVSFWKASVNPVSLSIVPYVSFWLKYLFICTFHFLFYHSTINMIVFLLLCSFLFYLFSLLSVFSQIYFCIYVSLSIAFTDDKYPKAILLFHSRRRRRRISRLIWLPGSNLVT